MKIDRRALVGIGAAALATPLFGQVVSADAESNEALARRYMDEVWNKGNFDALDDLVSEDYEPSDPDNSPGLAAIKSRIEEGRGQLVALIPDLAYVIESLVSTDERVMFRGEIKGNATNGKVVSISYFSELLIVDGRIKTEWSLTDYTEFLDAL
jgi:hypothetical protein